MSKYMFVIPTLSMGGAERVVSVLSSELARLGQDVVIIKYYNMDEEYPVNEKVKIISFVDTRKDYKKTSSLKKIGFVRKTIKEEKPDFVLPFLLKVEECVYFATRGMNANVFPSIRSNPNKLSKKTKIYMRKKFVRNSKCTFVQNQSQKDFFDKSQHDKIHILYNPVAAEFFNTAPKLADNEFNIISVGRLSKEKNFELLIKSFAKAFKDNSNFKLNIYGQGDLKNELDALIVNEGLSNQVKLAGRTNDIRKVYSEADMFVLSSDFEGMPNALLEAMAVGVPSIATNCQSGPSDIIDDGKNGLLVPINNVDAMEDAMRKLYESSELREKFSREGHKKIKDICSAENIAKRMIEICEAYK